MEIATCAIAAIAGFGLGMALGAWMVSQSVPTGRQT